jgi:bacterial/archaeal transporter family protein
MDRWIVYAGISMAFAGFTSVVAKLGLTGIRGELGLTIRTGFVFCFVMLFAAAVLNRAEFQELTWSNLFWLGLSGLTTSVSWVFYYKAIKEGEVSTVALIDKGSFLVAVLLAWLILGERMTWQIALGAALILAGILVVSKRS